MFDNLFRSLWTADDDSRATPKSVQRPTGAAILGNRRIIRAFDDFQNPPTGHGDPFDQFPAITAIRPNEKQSRQAVTATLEQQFAAIAVLNVRRVNLDRQQ